MVIAVAGKGGVGKSTLSALIVRYFVDRNQTPVLAVDADPNSTLNEKLGIRVECSLGDLREDVLKQKHEVPAGVPRQRAIEYEAEQIVTEGSGFDLLAMGRGEGPGCYCSINNILRTFLQNLSSGYKQVVVDNEAGMEHLSRRANDKVDLMLVVCDPTPTGLLTAKRIAQLAKDLNIVEGRLGLVINRATGACDPEEALATTGLELLACVPDDQGVREAELQSRSVFTLPADAPAVVAVRELLVRQGL